jgi:hypothetical protein
MDARLLGEHLKRILISNFESLEKDISEAPRNSKGSARLCCPAKI